MSMSSRSLLGDAVEVRVGAKKYLTVRDGWRRVARFPQIVHRQKLEFLRAGPEDGGHSPATRDIQPPGSLHERTPAFTAFEPFGPQGFSSPAFNALRGPGSGVDDVHPSI